MTDKPRFNHVAMTMPADALDAAGRAQILDFYGDVFGWQELPQMTEDRKRLVLMAYEFGQFVYLETSKDGMLRATPADHFGMSVATMGELDEMYEKAQKRAAGDHRVRLIDKHVDEYYGVLDLHSFYVQHLLPLMVEVQYFDWKADLAAMQQPGNVAAE
jgi:hypothetical protein